MRHLKGIIIYGLAIFSVAFLFVTSSSMVLGAVPGAQLELIAEEANLVNNDWKNVGTVEKSMRGGVKLGVWNMRRLANPVFEPAAGGEPSRVTATEQGQLFATAALAVDAARGRNPNLHLKDWTVELILKRNGPLFGPEHHIVGFHWVTGHSGDWNDGRGQWIKLGLTNAPGMSEGLIWLNLKGTGQKNVEDQKVYKDLVDIGLNKWHHILFTYQEEDPNGNTGRLDAWIDGVKRNTLKTQVKHGFDGELDMTFHGIFAHSFRETDSGFNGSIHLVRVYNRVLDNAEIQENLSVEPADKLTTTWGHIKMRH